MAAAPPPRASLPTLPPLTDVSARAEPEYPSLWRELERLVGYPMTDENFERAIVQAKAGTIARADARGVLVGHGVGQVLGVR